MENFSTKSKYIFAILIGVLVGWIFSYIYHTKSIKIEDKYAISQSSSTHQSSDNSHQNASTSSEGVPAYAMETLEYVIEHHEAPSGYVGGRVFQNREGQLPKDNSLKYQEWDVHPKVNGQNRGAERLITSSDGSAYFTSDHYRTFTKLK